MTEARVEFFNAIFLFYGPTQRVGGKCLGVVQGDCQFGRTSIWLLFTSFVIQGGPCTLCDDDGLGHRYTRKKPVGGMFIIFIGNFVSHFE